MNTKAMNTDRRVGRATTYSLGVAFAIVAIALGGCDFDVSNPGPVLDENLDNPGSFAGIVGGVERTLAPGVMAAAIDGGVRTREVHNALADWAWTSIDAHYGRPRPSDNSPWDDLQGARWAAEDGIRRLAKVLGASAQSDPYFAELNLWAGYASRFLGEYYCEVAFDAGGAQPVDAAFERAEALFTQAMESGSAAGLPDVVSAARAGRASVRVNLGDWAGSVEDAGGIATDFEWLLRYYENSGFQYFNAWFAGFAGQNEVTVWNTFYEDYYEATGDPRTPWMVGDPPVQEHGGLPEWDVVPRLIQNKYPSNTAPVQMSSGEEMRLIEAEALLEQGAGQMDAAMDIVNSLRARAGMDPWPAPADLDEAWTQLRTERGIELWLEGRRLFDRRRWAENGTPGVLDPHELGTTEGGPDLSNMELCLPIPDDERVANPNLPNP